MIKMINTRKFKKDAIEKAKKEAYKIYSRCIHARLVKRLFGYKVFCLLETDIRTERDIVENCNVWYFNHSKCYKKGYKIIGGNNV